MKIGIIGDLHLSEALPYANLVPDKRLAEETAVFAAIKIGFSKYDLVVMLGDQFHFGTNSSSVISKFLHLLESLNAKTVVLLAGNHEKRGNGESALDFLKEIKGKNWLVVTNKVQVLELDGQRLVFSNYFTNPELGTSNLTKANQALEKRILAEKGDFLFVHHALSSTPVGGITTDAFNEPVLDIGKLKKNYTQIVGGHIHQPSLKDNVLVAGSAFSLAVGDTGKSLWTWNDGFKAIPSPTRPIIKLENPTLKQLDPVPHNAIVKLYFTDAKKKKSAPVIEQYKTKRQRAAVEFDPYDMDALLEAYAKQKKVDAAKLKQGFELIKNYGNHQV